MTGSVYLVLRMRSVFCHVRGTLDGSEAPVAQNGGMLDKCRHDVSKVIKGA